MKGFILNRRNRHVHQLYIGHFQDQGLSCNEVATQMEVKLTIVNHVLIKFLLKEM